MKYKEDWSEAAERLSKIWYGEKLDRPCIAVKAPQENPVPGPAAPDNPEDRWLNPDWVIANMKAIIGNTWWGGESVPSNIVMGGWVVSLGGKPNLAQNTIWFDHFKVDFDQPSPFTYDPEDSWVIKYKKVMDGVIDFAGNDDFLIGQPSILPANDLLSMHMGVDEFLVNLIEHPDWMKKSLEIGARDILQAKTEIMEKVKQKHKFWYGLAGWMPFWAPEPFLASQSDVSCMLSPEMFQEFIVPELDIIGHKYDAFWYHLDGASAKQHLDTLLGLPYLKVLQYTPTANIEPPNGPENLDFFKKVQAAGKILHIQVPPQNIEPLLEGGLDPQLVIFYTNCQTIDEGKALLENSKNWL